ncbi:MAG TPA: hypothetical protein VGR07_19625 [Thermoanaerobaculia bacterium]|jgi:hypothetical protein|nr:hypothetical protein [Thermoanaerobaculia bacterium]
MPTHAEQHTPGPWKEGDGLSRGRFVFGADGTVVVEAARRNIALIAAAPELLAALRKVTAGAREVVDNEYGHNPRLHDHWLTGTGVLEAEVLLKRIDEKGGG